MTKRKMHFGFVGTTYPHYAKCSTRPKYRWELTVLADCVTCEKCKLILNGEPSAWDLLKAKRKAMNDK
jgi:hypothetical protein